VLAEPSSRKAATLSPELRALLACARAVLDPEKAGEFERAVIACPSAEKLCSTAIAHGMLGHLHKLVTTAATLADLDLARRLGDLQRLAAARNLSQSAHLLRLLDALESAGASVMVYKGPVWAETLYADITLRTWADLDLLVRRDQVALARDVLLANGYEDAERFNAAYLQRRWGSWGELGFTSRNANAYVEVHWEVRVSIGATPLPAERLLTRAQSVALLGRRVLAPSPVDAFLIDSIHGTKHGWDTIERLLGMALRVRSTTAADWPRVLTAARETGCRRRLVISVAHVSRVFALPVPAAISEIVDRGRRLEAHLRFLDAASLAEGQSESARRRLAVLLHWFATEDSPIAGLRHAATRFLCPGREDWDAIALPRRLSWLYYLLRPGRLAIKWLRHLAHHGPKTSRASKNWAA